MPTVVIAGAHVAIAAAAMAGAVAAGIMAAVARGVMPAAVRHSGERRRGGKSGKRENNNKQFHGAIPVCPVGAAPTRLAHRSIVSDPCRDAIGFIFDASSMADCTPISGAAAGLSDQRL